MSDKASVCLSVDIRVFTRMVAKSEVAESPVAKSEVAESPVAKAKSAESPVAKAKKPWW